MMNIYVCVGSSCHLRGSDELLQMMKDRIESEGLADKVHLAATFCLGYCSEGVSVKFDDQVVCMSLDNFDEVFQKFVLDKVK